MSSQEETQEANGRSASGPPPVRRVLSRVARVQLASACPARASLAASVCSASRECVPSQEQQAPRSAPVLLVCSHVVFCFRCAQVLPTFKSLIVPRDQAVGASDGSSVSLPPVSVARRRSSSHLAARALLARSPVAFCFCCAQEQSPSNSEQSHYPATVASEPVHKPASLQEHMPRPLLSSPVHPPDPAELARAAAETAATAATGAGALPTMARSRGKRSGNPGRKSRRGFLRAYGAPTTSMPPAPRLALSASDTTALRHHPPSTDAAISASSPVVHAASYASGPCTSTSHPLCPSTCTSTCTSAEQLGTLQDVNGMFNIRGYGASPDTSASPAVAAPPTNRSQPRITVQRSAAHNEQQLIDTLKVQCTMEFEINHGCAMRDRKGVWEHPVDTWRVVSEVFHPAIERAIKQSCAWSRTAHKRGHDCLTTSVPSLAYGTPAQSLDEPAATLLCPVAPSSAFRPRPLRSNKLHVGPFGT